MKWWRIRKVANAATWQFLMIGVGVLGGVLLVAFLPGMPWSAGVEPVGADTTGALDLAVQRSMASAAWFMVVITVVSTIGALLGLYFLVRTLQLTQRSTAAAEAAALTAKDIGRAQTRAYLSVAAVDVDKDDFDFALRIKVTVKNAGQSPATAATLEFGVYLGEHSEDPDLRTMATVKRGLPSVAASSETVFSIAVVVAGKGVSFDPPSSLVVSGSIRWQDVFGEGWDQAFRFSKLIGAGEPRVESLISRATH